MIALVDHAHAERKPDDSMICSHERGFIFLKTRKTAGTSLEIALSSVCGPADIITGITGQDEELRRNLGFRGPQNTEFPWWRASYRDWARLLTRREPMRARNHMGATDVRHLIGRRAFEEYRKITIVRNPWDAVVSGYFWNGGATSSVSQYLTSENYRRLVNGYRIYHVGNRMVADVVMRYEKLEADFRQLAQVLDLPDGLELPRAKGTSRPDRRHYREILSATQAEIIARDFRREIDMFGYLF